MAEELRGVANVELPRSFGRLRASYAPPSRRSTAADPAMPSADRAWGLMPLAFYRAAVDKALVRDWIPRFEKLGIDARSAWSRSG